MAKLFILLALFLGVYSQALHLPPSSMAANELSALFDVVSNLVADPTWSDLHPHPCSDTPWPGIQCELFQTLDSYLHVTRIHVGPDLASPPCKPNASLSPSILKLPHLKSLSIFNCFLDTILTLDPSLFTNTSSLEQLVLNSNHGLSGEIPASVSSVSSLRVLSLSQNNFSGSIPRELSGLGNLQQLDLSYNSLTGGIPDIWDGLPSLTILDMSFNKLDSRLPTSLGELHSLQKLDLSSNNISGQVPAALGNLKSLVLLDLSQNSLTGPMPNALAGLTELEYLMIENNPIGTTIPSFVGGLHKLAVLGFSGCGFVGGIPTFFGGLHNLTAVSLDKNRLNGSIPRVLGGLPKLGQLNLSQNQLTGDIGLSEEFVGRLGRRLDLRDNKGLCAENSIAVSVQAPPCLNDGNKTWGEGQGLDARGVNGGSSLRGKMFAMVGSVLVLSWL